MRTNSQTESQARRRKLWLHGCTPWRHALISVFIFIYFFFWPELQLHASCPTPPLGVPSLEYLGRRRSTGHCDCQTQVELQHRRPPWLALVCSVGAPCSTSFHKDRPCSDFASAWIAMPRTSARTTFYSLPKQRSESSLAPSPTSLPYRHDTPGWCRLTRHVHAAYRIAHFRFSYGRVCREPGLATWL